MRISVNKNKKYTFEEFKKTFEGRFLTLPPKDRDHAIAQAYKDLESINKEEEKRRKPKKNKMIGNDQIDNKEGA